MPRSPARDLSDRYVGKRGYFRNPDAIRRWKYILAWLALAGAGIWAAVDILQPAGASYAHTHGPLASPHAAFDDNCAACHVSQSFNGNPLAIFDTRDRWHDLSCGKCHAGPKDEGFGHHASANDNAKAYHQRCSNCHHDHLGRLNSLVRLSDADCNHCHRDLGKWHNADKSLTKTRGEQPYQNKITSFATDHPEFRSLEVDPNKRTLKFSHALHLAPGQSMKMTVGQIEKLANKSVAELYRKPGQDKDALVTLDCASCHKLDSGTGTDTYDRLKAAFDAFGEPSRPLAPPRAQGAYFLPINYDAHCRACHPLAANEGTNTTDNLQLLLPRFDLPHRRQAGEIRTLLKAGYVKELIASNHEFLKESPQPGGKLDVPPKTGKSTLDEAANTLVNRAEPLLLSAKAGCAKCHDTTGAGETLRIAPVPDRTVWLAHAKFNHAAHRGTTCATCHPGTEAAFNSASLVEKEPVKDNILGRDTCRACHSPSGTRVDVPDGSKISGGGVRAACTDCHTYHHGDMPFQGRGAQTRYPKEPRTLADWLKGK